MSSQAPLTWADQTLLELVSGKLPWKLPVRVMTLAHVSLVGFPIVDGVQLGPGDDVLVAEQNQASENGIYRIPLSASERWKRREDFDTSDKVKPMSVVPVVQGGTNAGKVKQLATTPPIVLGVTNLTFVPLGGNVGGGGGGGPFDVTAITTGFALASGEDDHDKFFRNASGASQTVELTPATAAGVACAFACTTSGSALVFDATGGATINGGEDSLQLTELHSTVSLVHLGEGAYLLTGDLDLVE